MTEKKNAELKGKSAFELFPDIMKNIPRAGQGGKKSASPSGAAVKTRENLPVSSVEPPRPPDISRLLAGETDTARRRAEEQVALLLMRDDKEKAMVEKSLEELGYAVEIAISQAEAVERMGADTANVVFLQDGFDGQDYEQSLFHQYMTTLPMSRRRSIYYVLIGPRFHTFYDLQALAASANLVINGQDLPRLDVILRKGLRQYDDLFGPYMKFLQEYGRR